ncbi:hypothetical protein SKAU_G00306720 [Synaphobranchus kaupii]|uniref:Uncharacterized protein n=1 Tax=Synaphobranchus kaupii TaxID=118154 RepID=A0A9Q1EQY0_SYNKA|nr:hypothetical protein SKAU_G00306720 [Synaphobranchus kaupii]
MICGLWRTLQAPPRGHALHAAGEVVSGLSQTHGGQTGTQLSRAGQLDQSDVIVDGESIVAGVLEDLSERDRERHLPGPGMRYSLLTVHYPGISSDHRGDGWSTTA